MNKSFMAALLLGAAVLTAQANITPTLSSIGSSGNEFSWNYSANVDQDQAVNSGNFFTIYDFSSTLPTTTVQPTGWSFSASLLGGTPSLVTVNDKPNLYNLTWTYNGPAIRGVGQAGTPLGIFSALSNTNQSIKGIFAAEATRTTAPIGTKIDNVGRIDVPVPEMSALLPILSVCAAGVVSMLPGFLRRRKVS